MLLGEYEHTIDDKNRLTLPAKFRKAFAGGVFLLRGLEPCVEAYTRDGFAERVEGRLGSLDPLSAEARAMRRFAFSGASDEELDKQGRVTIPPALLRHGGLGREVVVAGLHDHLEIWDRAAWRAQLAELEGSAPHVAERLAAQRT
jgi:transcriptional regulator MraZ